MKKLNCLVCFLCLIFSSCTLTEIDSKRYVTILLPKGDSIQNHYLRVFDKSGNLVNENYTEDSILTIPMFPAEYFYSLTSNTGRINNKIINNYYDEPGFELMLTKGGTDGIYQGVEPIYRQEYNFNVSWEDDLNIIANPRLFSSLIEIQLLGVDDTDIHCLASGLGTQIHAGQSKGEGFTHITEINSKVANSKVYKEWVLPQVENSELSLSFLIKEGDNISAMRNYKINKALNPGQYMKIVIDDLTEVVVSVTVEDWGDIESGDVEPIL